MIEHTVEALQQMRRVIEAIPRGRMHMGFWWRPDGFEHEDGHGTPCGCAIGWALQDEWFRASGLTLSEYQGPACEGRFGWDAVCAFFDATRDEVTWLFGIHGYDPEAGWRDQVLARLDRVEGRMRAGLPWVTRDEADIYGRALTAHHAERRRVDEHILQRDDWERMEREIDARLAELAAGTRPTSAGTMLQRVLARGREILVGA